MYKVTIRGQYYNFWEKTEEDVLEAVMTDIFLNLVYEDLESSEVRIEKIEQVSQTSLFKG